MRQHHFGFCDWRPKPGRGQAWGCRSLGLATEPPGAAVAQLRTDEPTWESLLDALPPRNVIATMQTTAMSATRSAYSTRLAPRSSVPQRPRTYGARYSCQK